MPPQPSPSLHTGTAALLGQPSVSQKLFLPRESELEEVASTAQGNNPLQYEQPW